MRAPRTRIAHIITGFGTGGAELMLARLAGALAERGWEQLIIGLSGDGPVRTSFEGPGTRVMHLDMPYGRPTVTGTIRGLQALRHFKPDVIQGWMYHANLFARLGGVLVSKGPVCFGIRHSLHALEDERPLTRMVIRMGAYAAQGTAAVVYNSRTSADQHRRAGYPATGVHIIPNGFAGDRLWRDERRGSDLRRRLGIDMDAPVIGMLARAHATKDHASLIEAFADLQVQWPAAQLLLAGPGVTEDAAEIVSLIGARGLGGAVHLLGPTKDVVEFMSAIDVHCLASRGEAFPNVLCEAMACGALTVSTDVGDVRDVVGGLGLVVPPRSPMALAQALRDVLALPAGDREAFRAGARTRVLEQFGLSAITDRYEELYLGL